MQNKLIYFQRAIKWLTLILMILSSTMAIAKQDNLVIFTASKAFSPLSSGKAKMLFKGKIKRLNNKRVTLLDWPDGSKIKKQFYQDLLGQSEARINVYRAKLVFSGKGTPPKTVSQNNYSAVKNYIKNKPNSISYALQSMVSKEFTILYIMPTGDML
jgi:ABC-type phosphate transport system substrate-binding protein